MGICSSKEERLDPSCSYMSRGDEEEEIQEIPLIHSQPIHSLCVADSTHLISGCADNNVIVYQWSCHSIKHVFQMPVKPVSQIVYNNISQWIYAGSRDSCIYSWKWPSSTLTESRPHTLKGHTLSVTALATSTIYPNVLVSGSRDNSVRFWDLETGLCVSTINIPRNLVTDLKWICDEPCILQSSEDKTLRVWDMRTSDVVQHLPSKQHIQLCCDASSCGNYFLSGSSGHRTSGSELTLWDRRHFNAHKIDNGSIMECRGHSSNINSCLFLRPSLSSNKDTLNENVLVSCSNDSTVRIWKQDTGDCIISEYISGAGPISDLASPSSSLIACSSFQKGIHIWGLQTTLNNEHMLYLRAKY